MAIVRSAADATENGEYELRACIEWTGAGPLQILTTDGFGRLYRDTSTPLHHFVPVELTLDARTEHHTFYQTAYEMAEDLINQGGVTNLQLMDPPENWSPPA